MHCVEILLPLFDREGEHVSPRLFERLKTRLVETFGGVTAFTRSAAEGRWQEDGRVEHDEVVVFEVMVDNLDPAWWAALRGELERDFRQKEIVVRSHEIRRL